MSKRIVFFGDSNTYGFDPRDFWGGRYEEAVCWTHRLALNPEWEVLEAGENGREIPHVKWQFDDLGEILNRYEPFDCFAVMLGTNDLFNMYGASAEDIVARMEKMLSFVMNHDSIRKGADGNSIQLAVGKSLQAATEILLIAPPEVKLTGDFSEVFRLVSHEMRGAYRRLAEKLEIHFADAGAWEIDMAYDGVHFSEVGHKKFALEIDEALKGLF